MTPRRILAAALCAIVALSPALRAGEPGGEAVPAVLHATSSSWRAVTLRPTVPTGARVVFSRFDAGRLAVTVSRGRRPDRAEPQPGADLLRVLQENCAPLPVQRADADAVPRARVVSLDF